jgi:transcriptional regulator with XRE-family HTH domain
MDATDISKPRGATVRMLRRDRGWTQKELAAAAEVSNLTIVRLENEEVAPHPKTLKKVANALGVRVPDLYEEPAVAGKAEALRIQNRLEDLRAEVEGAERGELAIRRVSELGNEIADLARQARQSEGGEAAVEEAIALIDRLLAVLREARKWAEHYREEAIRRTEDSGTAS